MSEHRLSTVEIWVILIILALMAVFLLAGCNAKNVEYRRYSGGELVENVRMGQVNFLYWFALNDSTIESKPLTVRVGSLTERNDPNSAQLATEALKLINKLP